MQKKVFDNYLEFIEYSKKYEKDITNIKYREGRLLEYNTKSYKCICPFSSSTLPPNAFVRELGIQNYSTFLHFNFTKLKEMTSSDREVERWKSGYFGGLIGINSKIINNYVGTGEYNTFYDYDINSAYMYQLTRPIPYNLSKVMLPPEYDALQGIDKYGKIYFFEIKIERVVEGEYYKALGIIKDIYSDFDFLEPKTNNIMVVSEVRLELINRVYHKSCYKILRVFEFDAKKFSIYQKILDNYMELKKDNSIIKKNGLMLYGSLGQIYNKKNTSLRWEGNRLYINSARTINYNSKPYIAMYVADTVALKLFEIITTNYDSIVSWNTDGLVSTKPLPLPISSRAGLWKCKAFSGIPILLDTVGKMVVYVDTSGNFYGAKNVYKNGEKIYMFTNIQYTHLKKGYVQKIYKIKLDPQLQYDKYGKLRVQLLRERFRKNILLEREI